MPDVGQLAGVIGFDPVPSSPVAELDLSVVVATGTWVEVVSYTVTTDKTFYLTDLFLTDGTAAAGIEFFYRVRVGGAVKIQGRIPAGHSLRDHLGTPLKVTSAVAATIEAYQWSGGDKTFHGGVLGFEV